MKVTLLRRLRKLEARKAGDAELEVRLGHLTLLPAEYTGQRHVAIVRRQRTGTNDSEWIEAEERPGPAPPGVEILTNTVLMTEDEANL